MKKFTQIHFKKECTKFGYILYKLKIIKPFVHGNTYSCVFNLLNPLSYVAAILMGVFSFVMAVLDSNVVQEWFDDMYDLIYYREMPEDVRWVKDLDKK